MNVFVVGAGGVSSVLATFLAKLPAVRSITIGTNNLARAQQFITSHKKIKLVRLDASKTNDIIRLASGTNLLINASLPNFNQAILRAALQIQANYQDLCSWLKDLRTPEQLAFDRAFRRAGLTAIINTGVAPGVTNLLARDLADKLDKVETINFRLLEEQQSSELVFSWSPTVTLDEVTAPPLLYRRGRFTLGQIFGDHEWYKFPAPYGHRMVVNLYGDEVATIPRYIPVRNVTFKSGGTDIDLTQSLYHLGLLSWHPIDVHGKKVRPVEVFTALAPQVPNPAEMKRLIQNGTIANASFVSIVEVIGRKNRRNMRLQAIVRYPDLRAIAKRRPGATYISYPTGLAAAAFAFLLLKHQKELPAGVYPPEALNKRARTSVVQILKSHRVIIQQHSFE